MKLFSTDVLVVGSGTAGLTAAIAAKKAGKKVLVVSKTAPGAATCSIVSHANFSHSSAGFSKEKHRMVSWKIGQGLNCPDLLDALIDNAENAVMELKSFGVNLVERQGGSYCPGKTPFSHGSSLVIPLVNYAKSSGVEFLSQVFIWEVLTDEQRVLGAWGVGMQDDEPILITAPAVILATGGGGALYKRSNNPSTITGDGYAIALRLGLPLIDMEFIQFYPLYTAFDSEMKKGLFIPPVVGEVALLVNRRNENLVEKYQMPRPIAVKSRDLASRAIMSEGSAFLDFSSVTDELWEKAAKSFGVDETQSAKQWILKRFANFAKVPICPVAHFFMGGVQTNSRCETGINGLYVCGEIVGGLHGANRLGGNALSEAILFGKTAGVRAAESPVGKKDEKRCIQLARNAVKQVAKQWDEHLSNEIVPPSFVYEKISDIMWQHVGVIRNQDGLQTAINQLSGLNKLTLADTQGTAKVLEVKNMLLVSQIIAKSALFRTESRGSHYRLDFPLPDDAKWKCHTRVDLTEGSVSITKLLLTEYDRQSDPRVPPCSNPV